jgi:hypothetical protein
MREKELKKKQEEAKLLEKERKKAEQAALLELKKVKPSEMFLKETDKYSLFDDKVDYWIFWHIYLLCSYQLTGPSNP